MDKEDRFPFEGDSSQYMNQKTVREVLELSSTGYGLESVSEEKDGNNNGNTKENNI
ncbi:hypothetical protein [Niallia endozanthoxylica]|uniref:hypothetical protein n=1 Tax=Niallia endozanthoxylica TaxID=2036016 RepID=UPI00168B291D|nr:hypothetical protein [Niallia endozanthoxylica]